MPLALPPPVVIAAAVVGSGRPTVVFLGENPAAPLPAAAARLALSGEGPALLPAAAAGLRPDFLGENPALKVVLPKAAALLAMSALPGVFCAPPGPGMRLAVLGLGAAAADADGSALGWAGGL